LRSTSLYILFFFLFSVTVFSGCSLFNKSAGRNNKTIDGGNTSFKNEADKIFFDNLFFDATKAKLLGRYEEAIDKFNKCLKINKNVADVYYQLYICYGNLGKQQAVAMLNKSIELAPKNTWYLEEKADLLKRNRRYVEAADLYQQLVKLNPEKVEYYENAVDQLVLAKKAQEAISLLDEMEAKFGIAEEIIRKKEDLYLYMGKPDKAVEEVNKLLIISPNNVTYMGLLAELYSLSGKTDEAIELFNKILKIEPKNGKAHFGLSALYRQKGDSANTIKELKLGFEDAGVVLKEKINVILSLAPLGDRNPTYRKQVFELAEILVQVHPNEPQAHAVYADLLFGDKQFEKAIEQYEATLSFDKNKFRVWQQLLNAYEQTNNNEKLEQKSDEALELFPNRVIFYYYNAVGAYRLKNYRKAASTAQAGIDLGIGEDFVNVGLYSTAGDAYYRLREYEECYIAFDGALAIDPQNAYVLNNYAYYLSEQGERLEKALAMSKKALAQQPNSPAYLDTYGWILYKSGRYTDAKEYIKKALDLSPKDMELLEHMGDVEYQLGNKEAAIEYWKKARENGNDSAQLQKKINEGKLFD
jgi:tetratricopeptide (TPR) repeat protein